MARQRAGRRDIDESTEDVVAPEDPSLEDSAVEDPEEDSSVEDPDDLEDEDDLDDDLDEEDDEDEDDEDDEDEDVEEDDVRSEETDAFWESVKIDVVEIALPKGMGYTLRAYRMDNEITGTDVSSRETDAFPDRDRPARRYLDDEKAIAEDDEAEDEALARDAALASGPDADPGGRGRGRGGRRGADARRDADADEDDLDEDDRLDDEDDFEDEDDLDEDIADELDEDEDEEDDATDDDAADPDAEADIDSEDDSDEDDSEDDEEPEDDEDSSDDEDDSDEDDEDEDEAAAAKPEEVPVFLSSQGQLLLFRSREGLVDFVRSGASHDLSQLASWPELVEKITVADVVPTDEDRYELDLVVENLRGGYDAWDPELLIQAGEIARDLGYGLRLDPVQAALAPGSPLDDLDDVMRSATGGRFGGFFARRKLKKIGAEAAPLGWRTIIGKISAVVDWRD